MNIGDYLVISAVNLVCVVIGHTLAKPWLDKRLNRPPTPQAPTPSEKRSTL